MKSTLMTYVSNLFYFISTDTSDDFFHLLMMVKVHNIYKDEVLLFVGDVSGWFSNDFILYKYYRRDVKEQECFIAIVIRNCCFCSIVWIRFILLLVMDFYLYMYYVSKREWKFQEKYKKHWLEMKNVDHKNIDVIIICMIRSGLTWFLCFFFFLIWLYDFSLFILYIFGLLMFLDFSLKAGHFYDMWYFSSILFYHFHRMNFHKITNYSLLYEKFFIV